MGSAGVPPASGGILPPSETQATYGYSPTTGRLETVSNGSSTFRYDYLADSSLIEHVVATAGAVHDVHLAYDPTRNVLASRQNQVGTNVISQYDYTVNSLGQRSAVAQVGTAFQAVRAIDWQYDSLGQVIQADSSENTHDRAYQFDTIGNRLQGSAGVPPASTETTYLPNSLNQYQTITTGGASLSPIHDFDGNMTSGPLPAAPTANSSLTWDAENRLIETTVGPNGPLVQNYYDAQSRRIATTSGGETTVYVYDSWNCIAEYSIQNSTFSIQHANLWGLDLSGTMQGAGGVGGLLAVKSGNAIHYPTFDGNGNVSEYLAADGAVAAHFEYDPFGNTVVNTDTTNQFAYRFSTKPQDSTTGLCYYGYRWMDPLTGRWPSRDPIEERGGVNLYSFVENAGVIRLDRLGMLMIDPIVVNPNDGMGFWETASHYFFGKGADITVPFSSIDPGWEMADLYDGEVCDHLGSYISYFGSPRPIRFSKLADVFDVPDIVTDGRSGISGPGRLPIDVEGNLYFESIRESGDSTVYAWIYSVYLSAPDNLIDFDPNKGWDRGIIKELITMGVDFVGMGDNYWMKFSGGRGVSGDGACCCKKNGSGSPKCSKIE